MEKQIINISTIIKAERATVWNYYTTPEHITGWNFAHESWECPSAENDLRVGGTYKARMQAVDGSMGFDFEAIYTAITPGHHLAYRLLDDRAVDVKMTEEAGGTLVSIAFEPENEQPLDFQQAGWQAILDNFKQYAEGLTSKG
jgi:uncharacterized protein YndB with AHSA1/START domain